MKLKTMNKSFETYDLGLATAIFTEGYTLNYLDKTNPSKVVFYFDHTTDLNKIVQAYWSKQLKQCSLEYFNNLKILKSRIYG